MECDYEGQIPINPIQKTGNHSFNPTKEHLWPKMGTAQKNSRLIGRNAGAESSCNCLGLPW